MRFILLLVRSAFHEPKTPLVELFETKTKSLLSIGSETSCSSVGGNISEKHCCWPQGGTCLVPLYPNTQRPFVMTTYP